MPRASDFQLAGEGLQAFRDAITRNAMFQFQQEQAEEAKRQQEAQLAERVAARLQEQKARAAMLDLQKQTAADRKAFQQGQLDRQTRLDTANSQGQADAAARSGAFSNLLSGGAAAPQDTSQFEHLNPTGEPQPLTAENILKAGAQTGALTPEQLAEIALRNQSFTAKADKPHADVQPQAFKVQLENGAQVVGIHNPRTGAYQVFGDKKDIVAKALLDDKGQPVPGKFVVDGKVIEAKQPQLIKTKEIYDELARLDDWEAQNPPPSRVGNKALGEQYPVIQARRNSLLRTLQALSGGAAEPSPAAAPPPAGQPAAAPGIAEGQTATNPKTGEKIIFRSGSWQPLK